MSIYNPKLEEEGPEDMSPPRRRGKDERQSTYFVQDRTNKDELARVTLQDQMITAAMVLALCAQVAQVQLWTGV